MDLRERRRAVVVVQVSTRAPLLALEARKIGEPLAMVRKARRRSPINWQTRLAMRIDPGAWAPAIKWNSRVAERRARARVEAQNRRKLARAADQS